MKIQFIEEQTFRKSWVMYLTLISVAIPIYGMYQQYVLGDTADGYRRESAQRAPGQGEGLRVQRPGQSAEEHVSITNRQILLWPATRHGLLGALARDPEPGSCRGA